VEGNKFLPNSSTRQPLGRTMETNGNALFSRVTIA
jgi:hypothetical protein